MESWNLVLLVCWVATLESFNCSEAPYFCKHEETNFEEEEGKKGTKQRIHFTTLKMKGYC